MILGVFLSPGDSLKLQSQSGQLDRLVKYYLKPYCRHFKQVIIFSYGDRHFRGSLPSRVRLVAKPIWIPNSVYQLIMPLVQYRAIKLLTVGRVFQAPGGIPAIITKLLFRKPYIVTYGYDYVRFAKESGRPFLALSLALVVPAVLRMAKQVIVTDRKNLSSLKQVYIPNGVDPDESRPAAGRRPNLVLSVGRLEPQKNYFMLVRAIGALRRRPDLVIIGSGSQKEKLVVLADPLKVKWRVVAIWPRLSLRPWYQKAAVFALTSKYEGHPKTLIEAMSCACPCLTTEFAGNPLEAGRSGLVARDETELSRQLEQLLSDSVLAARLGNAARKQVISRYNITKLISSEIKLLC